jgi:hypothetical protein
MQVAIGYLKSLFWLDMLTCAPLYWLFFNVPWARANRLLNFVRLTFDVEEMHRLCNHCNIKVHSLTVSLSLPASAARKHQLT